MKSLRLLGMSLILMGLYACATRIPTVTFPQYGLNAGSSATQMKSDIEITVKPIRISDIYEYPDLFGFKLADFPEYKDNDLLKRAYPVGPQGLQWEYPFSTMDGQEQLFICWVRIENNTDHILRMRDARVYFIGDGEEPVPALSDLDALLQWADYFERKVPYPLPTGFYRNLVLYHRPSYKLVTDLGTEILPGFAYQGLLVFPPIDASAESGTISFFDITVKTDAAGNPLEKTRFDFPLTRETVHMWYDREAQMWKLGLPPSES